jgi:hypothetical protein
MRPGIVASHRRFRASAGLFPAGQCAGGEEPRARFARENIGVYCVLARFVRRIVASWWCSKPFFTVREFQQFDNSPAAIATPARTCRRIGEVFGHLGQKRRHDFGGALRIVFNSETNVGFGQTKQPEMVGKAQQRQLIAAHAAVCCRPTTCFGPAPRQKPIH